MAERGLAWISENWIEILTALLAGLLIYLALGLVKRLLQRLFSSGAKTTPIMGVFAEAARRTSHWFMLIVAVQLVIGFADPPNLVVQTVRFLATVLIVWQVAIWLRQIVLGVIKLRSDPEQGGSEALANASGLIRVLVSVAIFAVAIVVVLDNLGVNVTALVAGLGIGGIAIGLAAQGIFSDLFASLSIIFDKPFKVGDPINFGTLTGTVERIGLKSTRLRAVTGERMIVSNAQLLNKEIVSYAALNRRRLKFAIGVIYQTAPEAAEAIPAMLQAVVEENGAIFVRAGFVGFGPSSLDYETEFDVFSTDWEEVFATRHRVGLAILRRFNEAGLSFAYPTQTTFTAAPDGRMIMPFAEWPAQVTSE